MRVPGLNTGVVFFTILILACDVSTAFSDSLSGGLAFRGRRFRDDVYINLAVDSVSADTREVARGGKITFEVTLHNKGETIRGPLMVRALSGRKTLASKMISDFSWNVKDKMVVTFIWDTAQFEPGSYPIKVEAPLFEDQDSFDNELKLEYEIVIR